MLSWDTSNRSYRGSLKVWQPKWAGLQYLQTWEVQKIIQGKSFIQCTVGVTITIASSIQVEIRRSTKIVLRFLFVFHFCYFPKHFPVHCAHPNKVHCMVSWLNIASPSQYHLGIPRRLKRVSPMYHIEWGGHNIRRRWVAFFLPSLTVLKDYYMVLVRRGGQH